MDNVTTDMLYESDIEQNHTSSDNDLSYLSSPVKEEKTQTQLSSKTKQGVLYLYIVIIFGICILALYILQHFMIRSTRTEIDPLIEEVIQLQYNFEQSPSSDNCKDLLTKQTSLHHAIHTLGRLDYYSSQTIHYMDLLAKLFHNKYAIDQPIPLKQKGILVFMIEEQTHLQIQIDRYEQATGMVCIYESDLVNSHFQFKIRNCGFLSCTDKKYIVHKDDFWTIYRKAQAAKINLQDYVVYISYIDQYKWGDRDPTNLAFNNLYDNDIYDNHDYIPIAMMLGDHDLQYDLNV